MGDDEEAEKGLEGDGKKTGGDEGKRKAGRPRKIEELDKERRGSTGGGVWRIILNGKRKGQERRT